MRIGIVVRCVLVFSLGYSACNARELNLTYPALSFSDLLLKAVAPSGLPTVRLRLGKGFLSAEVAHTPRQNASGLSTRGTLEHDGAMLFTFSPPRRVVFSMRNTRIPLSCAYIGEDGTVLETYDMLPGSPSPLASKSDRVQFVLEVNRGWFEQHGVAAGTRVMVAD